MSRQGIFEFCCRKAKQACETRPLSSEASGMLPETIEIHSIDGVEVAVEPWNWDFAESRRAEIDRHFAARQRARPALWNGRVLLLNRYVVTDGVLRGACFETDFASFLAWRDWDFPDPGVFNIFAAAALQSADGAYLVGEMAPSTAAAGQIYFPCGTPDPRNVGGGKLNLDHSLRCEFLQETRDPDRNALRRTGAGTSCAIAAF